jgi:ABC-type cobalamin/Fe3+-siderophores transport system ATPase subunit
MTALVSVTDLSHRYGGTAVLDLPHWEVEAAKHQLVIGPPGSGKSTLLSILSGLLMPPSGDIEISGQSLGKPGAPLGRLLRLRILEGVTLTAAGVILGLLLGHLGAKIIGHWLADARHVEFSGAVWVKEELWLVLAALGLGVMAALIPLPQRHCTNAFSMIDFLDRL